MQHLGGAADGANLHDGVKHFDMTQPHELFLYLAVAAWAVNVQHIRKSHGLEWPCYLVATAGAGVVSTSSRAAVSPSGVPSNKVLRYFIWKAISTLRVASSKMPVFGVA